MTQLSTPSRPRRRLALPRLARDPETRSLQVGVLGTILIHLLLLWLGPKVLRLDHSGAPSVRPPVVQEFSIDLAPETPEAKPPPPDRFVETNPDAPENIPDKTRNFAARNQQVAQEKPTPDGKNDMPALEGQTEIKTTQIVTGQLLKPPMDAVPPAPASVETPANEKPVAAAKQEQIPLPGFEKREGEDKDAYGSNVAEAAPHAQHVPERIEGLKDAPLIQGATSLQPQIDPKRPRPRPQIVKTTQVRPAIFTENKFGTQNVGVIGVSAQFSNYGAYLQKMTEAVQIQWERILNESRIFPPGGTHVTVKFVMNKEGGIARIVSVDNKSTQQAAAACTSAITDRAPYGAWTDDMIAVLGEEQELTFSFYYQ